MMTTTNIPKGYWTLLDRIATMRSLERQLRWARKAFGHQLRVTREELDWVQEELAERLGVTGATISRWESGKSEPSPEHLRLLADLIRGRD
jgi:DNA-binding transcriptional regulator YiaG